MTLPKNTDKQFYQTLSNTDINLAPNTKIIKAKDSTNYFDALSLLEEARLTLEKSKIEATTIKAHAQKQGYEEGLNQADIITSQKHMKTISDTKVYLSEVECKLTNTVLTVIRKILNDYNDIDFVTNNITSLLKKIDNNQKISLHVNDTLIQEINTRLKKTFEDSTTIINLVPDSSLNKKDCIAITELGIINATLERQLLTIESCFSTEKK